MGKSAANLLDSILSNGVTGKKIPEPPTLDIPPKIPPRMKKTGPDLPEKPAHMRPKNQNQDVATSPSSQAATVRDSDLQLMVSAAKPRVQQSSGFRLTNNDRFAADFDQSFRRSLTSGDREVLVAASRGGRERPVEKRQREPAKLLTPTSGSQQPDTRHHVVVKSSSAKSQSKALAVLPAAVSSRRQQQPVVLIPRGFLVDNRVLNHVAWGSPLSYALWLQQQQPVRKQQREIKPTPILTSSVSRARSGSVTRSGSLTSQGSSSSDSGNETFPKSVLKKHRRNGGGGSLNPKSSHAKTENKKNVTFNAFATVQLMEE